MNWKNVSEILTPPLMTPDGDVRQVFCFSSDVVSQWLGTQLEEILKSFPRWQECHPIILGSWARGELCPKSDLDVLFCGDESIVVEFVSYLQGQGLKLRYRVPADLQDWTVNVEAFDILALLKAKPWTPLAAQKLFEQQKKIWEKKKYFRRVLLKALQAERQKRLQRYDSITNYLEPNLKFGPGGLRDLEQGLQIYELFAEKFKSSGHALNVLKYYRSYFLSLRQKMHSEGLTDILSGSAQIEVGTWMGFKSHKDFMRDLQRGLSRVHFYSDWIIEVAAASESDLLKVERLKFSKLEDLAKVLHNNSSVLIQKQVRENLDTLLPEKKLKSLSKRRGKVLSQIFSLKNSEEVISGVFRSRLIDKLVPDIRRLVGYVQHDQYHRFTADAHILQACREVLRVYKKPSELGVLRKLHQECTEEDWKILLWTSLYHDLAKGLAADSSHSDMGREIVKKDFRSFGFSKKWTEEVQWMVQNHLELSQAAFRRNPRDPLVWQDLIDKGVTGARLRRLALFTVIDIRATNPEAWNDWKARLLKDLVSQLGSQRAQDFLVFQNLQLKKKLNLPMAVIEELGPVLIENIETAELVADLKKAESSVESLKPWVCRSRRGDLWVRFHSKEDRQGLLSDFVSRLYSLGLGVRHASIHTLSKVGVYDWFQVTSHKDLAQLHRLFALSHPTAKLPPAVHFDEIRLVSANEREWVLSFKGVDQPGFLVAAVTSLTELGVSIKSARVHTWGRQVDDIFTIQAPAEVTPDELLLHMNRSST